SILTLRLPPRFTLFPYTTLFRSLVMGYVKYRQQLANLNELLELNQQVGSVKNLQAGDPDSHSTVVLVIGESTNGRRMGIYGYSRDRKSTRLNSSHVKISYAVFCL